MLLVTPHWEMLPYRVAPEEQEGCGNYVRLQSDDETGEGRNNAVRSVVVVLPGDCAKP